MSDDYAIVVGIDNYAKMPDDSSFSALTSAVADATQFKDWLCSPAGGNIDNTDPQNRRIIDIISSPLKNPSLSQAKPIKDQIDEALKRFGFEGKKRIGDRFYFYFSGHGIAPESDQIAMMMANASRTGLDKNISLNSYREYLRQRYLFDEFVFIADCCRTREIKKVEMGVAPFIRDKDEEIPPMRDVTILAAEYGQESFAISGGKGLLTQALLEGLKGDPGAIDQQGRITSNTLKNHVRVRVTELAKENQLTQSPRIDLMPEQGGIIFAKTQKKYKFKIVAAKHIKGDLIILDGENNEIPGPNGDTLRRAAKDARKDSPWEVELFDSLIPYRLRRTTTSLPSLFVLKEVKENNNVLQIS